MHRLIIYPLFILMLCVNLYFAITLGHGWSWFAVGWIGAFLIATFIMDVVDV